MDTTLDTTISEAFKKQPTSLIRLIISATLLSAILLTQSVAFGIFTRNQGSAENDMRLLAFSILHDRPIRPLTPQDEIKNFEILKQNPYEEVAQFAHSFILSKITQLETKRHQGPISQLEIEVLVVATQTLASMVNESSLSLSSVVRRLEDFQFGFLDKPHEELREAVKNLSFAFIKKGGTRASLNNILLSFLNENPTKIDESALSLLFVNEPIPISRRMIRKLIEFYAQYPSDEVVTFLYKVYQSGFFDSDKELRHRSDEGLWDLLYTIATQNKLLFSNTTFRSLMVELQGELTNRSRTNDGSPLGSARPPENRNSQELTNKAFVIRDLFREGSKSNQKLPRVLDLIRSSTVKPPALLLLPGPAGKSNFNPVLNAGIEKATTEFREFMKTRLIGQEEVVNTLSEILVSDLLNPKRTKPELLYLMGEPGTGKDTSVQAFVDFIHQKEGAYHDHMYDMPVATDAMSMAQITGSSTGYIGSKEQPEFLILLAKHSGGRYIYVPTDKDVQSHFIENPDWKGENLPGELTPQDLVIFVNEFKDWSLMAKNQILKQFIESGLVKIKSPGTGVHQMFVFPTIVFASNEGIDLIDLKGQNGQALGRVLTYEEKLANWQNAHKDPARLKESILKTNFQQSSTGSPAGISPEMLSRIPNHRIQIMKPLSPEEQKQIAHLKLLAFAKKLNQGIYKNLKIKWTKSVLDYIQSFDPSSEQSGRSIDNKINNLIETTFRDAIKDKKINLDVNEIVLDVAIKTVKGKPLAYLVVLEPTNKGAPENMLGTPFQDSSPLHLTRAQRIAQYSPLDTRLIEASKHVRHSRMLTPEELKQAMSLANRLKKHVIGQDEALEHIAKSLLAAQIESAKVGATRLPPAQAFFAYGLSSTGKTETAIALAKEVYGGTDKLKKLDFGQIKSVQDMKNKILGTRNAMGQIVPSEFMLAYDQLPEGRGLFLFDEISNCGGGIKEVRDAILYELYEILREGMVTGFVDGKPRKMGNLVLFMTGNTGQEPFMQVPKDIPLVQQMDAFERIYDLMMKEPSRRRDALLKDFTNALLARIGEDNLILYRPLNYQGIRGVTHLKMQAAIKEWEFTSDYHYKIRFATEADYLAFLDMIEMEFMVALEQGASIDRGVRKVMGELGNLLATKSVPRNSTVLVGPPKLAKKVDGEMIKYEIPIEYLRNSKSDKKPLSLALDTHIHHEPLKENPSHIVQTAYHEAGHGIVRKVLAGSLFNIDLVTIRPGVGEINGEWIYYAGLASSSHLEAERFNYDYVIRSMAVLAGGYMAEELMTSNADHDAGKQNDIKRAANLAYKAILEWGLSEAWGTDSKPGNLGLAEYIASLSPERKILLEHEVKNMVTEAEIWASAAILNNFEMFRALGYRLAEVREMKGPAIQEIFSRFPLVEPKDFKWEESEKLAKKSESKQPLTPEQMRRIRGSFGSTTVQWKYPDSVPPVMIEDEEYNMRVRQTALNQMDLKGGGSLPLLERRQESHHDLAEGNINNKKNESSKKTEARGVNPGSGINTGVGEGNTQELYCRMLFK